MYGLTRSDCTWSIICENRHYPEGIGRFGKEGIIDLGKRRLTYMCRDVCFYDGRCKMEVLVHRSQIEALLHCHYDDCPQVECQHERLRRQDGGHKPL